jgi:hypothetical protein
MRSNAVTNCSGSFARITPRLADCATARVSVDGRAAEPGRRQAGLLQRSARQVLVASDPGGSDRVGDEPEPGSGLSRDNRGGVVYVDDGVERLALGQVGNAASRAGRAGQVEADLTDP